MLYGVQEKETYDSLASDPDVLLLPLVLEKVIIPKMTRKFRYVVDKQLMEDHFYTLVYFRIGQKFLGPVVVNANAQTCRVDRKIRKRDSDIRTEKSPAGTSVSSHSRKVEICR